MHIRIIILIIIIMQDRAVKIIRRKSEKTRIRQICQFQALDIEPFWIFLGLKSSKRINFRPRKS